MTRLRALVLATGLLAVVLAAAACTAAAPPPGISQQEVEDIVSKAMEKRLNEVDTKLAVWSIQPGTAPRMMELTHFFNNMWYAAQAGNWLFAEFEVYRTDETLKAIKVVRPKRAKGVDDWTKESLEPLQAAVKAKNLSAFTTAYDKALGQCNSCHVDSDGGGISLKGVKITRPSAPLFTNVDYKGN